MASSARGRGRGRKTDVWVDVEPRPGLTRRQTYRAMRHEEWLDRRAAERRWIVEEAVDAYEQGLSLRQVADHLNVGFPDGEKISYTGVRMMLIREGVDIRSRDTAPSSTALTLVAGRFQMRFDDRHPKTVKVRLPREYDQLLQVVERASEELVPGDMRRLVRVLMWLKAGPAQEEADWGKPLPGATTVGDAIEGGLRVRRGGPQLDHGPWKPITIPELAERAGIGNSTSSPVSRARVLARNLSEKKIVEPVWPVWDRVLEVLGWYVEVVSDPETKPHLGQRLPADPFTLGQVLRQHRQEPYNLTQETGARAAGIDRTTLGALEDGERPTQYATVAAALKRCGVTCRLVPFLDDAVEEELRSYRYEQEREAEYLASLRNYPR
jgi:DNA-binding XRE family transcriptional regulator